MEKVVAEDEKLLQSKRFTGYLVLDYRNGDMRVRKTKPEEGRSSRKSNHSYRHLSPFEIPIMIDIKVNVPKGPEITAKGEVDIPATKVREMFLETL